MLVAVRARNIDVPAELRAAAEEQVQRLARRVGGMDRAEVRFLEERAHRGPGPEREVCEVTMRGHGHVVRARGAGGDWPAAVGRTVGKLERQVERLRAKLAARARLARSSSVQLLSHDTSDVGAEHGPVASCGRAQRATPSMTPEAAALQMDQAGQDLYFFVNVENGSTGAVFRRTDGHIGLIDAG